jgi:hypothetical protein
MGVDIVSINDALAFRDSSLSWRLYDAVGSGVVKHIESFAAWPVDDTTGDPTEWTPTITEAGAGDTTMVITDKAGGALLITCAANEDDGVNLQLGQVAGESVKLDGSYPLYCGIRLAVNDADQVDLFFGVGVTDTDWSGGITDGVYFSSVDESAVVNFVTEKNSVESSAAVATLVDDTFITLEFYFDGASVYSYVNGVLASSQASGAATFPDDEELRLTLEFLTGEATANTCTVEWLRMIHVR